MSGIVYVKEKHASCSSGGGTAQKVFYVKTATRMGPALVSTAPGLPRAKELYSEPGYTDPNLWAQWPPNVRPLSRLLWEVTFQYREPPQGSTQQGGDSDPDPSPLADPPEWDDTSETITFYPAADVNEKLFQNSAHYAFDAVGVPWSVGIVTVSRNVGWYDRARAEQYRNTINATAFAGYPAETVCCWNVSGKSATRGKWNYAVETWQFKINTHVSKIRINGSDSPTNVYDAWKMVLADRGPFHLLPRENAPNIIDKVPAQLRDKEKWGGLVPLDGKGAILSQTRQDSGDVNFVVFDVRKKLDFNALRLGNGKSK